MVIAGIKRRLSRLPILRGFFSLIDHWAMRRYFDKIGMAKLERKTRAILPLSVQKGPFARLKLLNRACGSVWIPKLLGCYEMELAFAVEEIVRTSPDLIVDVGCAEGYFAVGFAFRIAAIKVIAADTNPIARRMVRKIAMMNNVQDRVMTTGWITCAMLERLLSASINPVVWCDIEGGERELLDPKKVPSLRKARILVEGHRHVTGIPISELLDRFSATHDHRVVDQTSRSAEEWIPQDLLFSLGEDEMKLAMAELRPPDQEWLFLRPRAN